MLAAEAQPLFGGIEVVHPVIAFAAFAGDIALFLNLGDDLGDGTLGGQDISASSVTVAPS